MAFAPHTLIAFGGKLTDRVSSVVDIWECTIRAVQLDSHDRPVSNPAGLMNGMADPLATWFTTAANKMSSAASLGYLKVNTIGPDGKYASSGSTNVHDYATGIVGGAAPSHPYTESWCYSWGTAIKRGPGARGRIYPPNGTTQFGDSVICTGAEQAAFLTSAQNLLKVINIGDGNSAAGAPVIASRVNATNTIITTIRIGRVVDSQRRRRSAIPENYVEGLSNP